MYACNSSKALESKSVVTGQWLMFSSTSCARTPLSRSAMSTSRATVICAEGKHCRGFWGWGLGEGAKRQRGPSVPLQTCPTPQTSPSRDDHCLVYCKSNQLRVCVSPWCKTQTKTKTKKKKPIQRQEDHQHIERRSKEAKRKHTHTPHTSPEPAEPSWQNGALHQQTPQPQPIAAAHPSFRHFPFWATTCCLCCVVVLWVLQ